jgi:hypothetical protein
MPILNQDPILEEIRKDVKNIKYQSYIQTAAVIAAFFGIVSIAQFFAKKKP